MLPERNRKLPTSEELSAMTELKEISIEPNATPFVIDRCTDIYGAPDVLKLEVTHEKKTAEYTEFLNRGDESFNIDQDLVDRVISNLDSLKEAELTVIEMHNIIGEYIENQKEAVREIARYISVKMEYETQRNNPGIIEKIISKYVTDLNNTVVMTEKKDVDRRWKDDPLITVRMNKMYNLIPALITSVQYTIQRYDKFNRSIKDIVNNLADNIRDSMNKASPEEFFRVYENVTGEKCPKADNHNSKEDIIGKAVYSFIRNPSPFEDVSITEIFRAKNFIRKLKDIRDAMECKYYMKREENAEEMTEPLPLEKILNV